LGDFLEIVGLSISVSLAATAIAAGVSLPIGAALAIFRFRGRRLIVVLINAFFGLPPVVVGLVLYLALSRSGPLGSLALLFTPTAMVMAQTILAIPIITALVHRGVGRPGGLRALRKIVDQRSWLKGPSCHRSVHFFAAIR